MNQGDYAKALEIYENNKDDEKKLARIMDCNEDFCDSFSGGTESYKLLYSSNVFFYDETANNILTNQVIDTIDTVYNNYINEENNSEDTIYMLGLYLDFSDDTITSKAQECIDDVYANEEEKAEIAALNEINEMSGNNYMSAEEYISEGKYSLAYDNLLLVDPQSDYYDDAVGLMEEVKDWAVEESLNNADLSIEAGEYANALDYIEKALEYDSENEMALAKKDACTQAYMDYLKKSASDASTNQDYQASIDYIDEALLILPDDEELLELKQTYTDLQLEQIEAAKTLTVGKVFDTTHATITVKNIAIVDHVYPESRTGYYLYYSVKDTDKTWFDIELKVKNNSAGVLNVYTMIENPKLTYNNLYHYNTYGIYYSKGSDIDSLYSWYTKTLDPLETCTLHVVIECPIDVKTGTEPIIASLTIDGVYQFINYR